MKVTLRDPKILKPVTLSAAALQQVKKEMEKRGSGIGIRLYLQTAGCSGYMYKLNIVDEIVADDYFFDGDIKIYVENKSYPLLKGTEIDFVREGLNQLFKYNNPNETGACGCGESFTVGEQFK
jgi:iron-sulfur cluster assembly protein